MAWITGKRGAFRVMWRTGGRGSKVQASRTFTDKADAAQCLREVEAGESEKRTLRGPALGSTPLPELLKRWQLSRISGMRAREPYTIEAMAHVQRIIDEMEWRRVSDITTEAIDRWRSKRVKGKGTDKPLQCLKSFVHWCRRSLRLRIDDGVLDIESRRVQHRKAPPMLTDEQVALIIARALTFGLGFGTLVEHLLLYACRPVDVCRMRVKDWDSAARTVTYRDTKNFSDTSHLVHASHALRLDEIAEGRSPEEFLFLNKNATPWELTRIGQAQQLTSWYKANVGEWVIRKDVDADGNVIKIYALPPGQRGIYCLKDYAMSRLSAAAGGDRRSVVAISGHKSLGVVDRYMSSNEATQRKLIEAIPAPV